jgi:S-adenosylmethionine synthetase
MRSCAVWPRRKSGAEPTLRPDAKSQLSLRYEDGKPVEVTSIVLSTQHTMKRQTSDDIRAIVEPYIREVLPEGWITPEATEWWVNPTGTFVIGGPDGDAGLTGARSSSTPMAGPPRMAAARFRARTRPRLTARPPMPRAIWQRTWWRRALPSAAPCRSAMPSAWPSPCRSMSTPTAPARSRPRDRKGRGRGDGPDPARHPHPSGPEPPIYARTSAYGHFGRAPEADGGFSAGNAPIWSRR